MGIRNPIKNNHRRVARNNPEKKMPLVEHLREFRRRLIIGLGAIVLAFIAGWFLSELVWDLLRAPIERIAEERNATLNYPQITSAFDLKLTVSFYLGIFIASPIWLYQIWAFILPGLKRKEKVYSISFFLSAVPLFLAGLAAGWLIFPNIVLLLTGFAPAEDASIIDARYYFDFAIKLMLATGIAFALPVFLVLLNFVGVLSARSMLKGWRWAVLIIIIFAGAATPAADILSMFLLAVPMIVLYFLAVGISWLHDRRLAKKQKKADAALSEQLNQQVQEDSHRELSNE